MIVVGCILIALGTFGSLVVSQLRDRFRAFWYWGYLLLACGITAAGTWITINGGSDVLQAARAETLFKQTKQENAEAAAEMNRKIEGVRTELRATKNTSGNSQKVEKIEDEFKKWAEDFAMRRPAQLLEQDPKDLGDAARREALSLRWRPRI
jgi:hypothetical protein